MLIRVEILLLFCGLVLNRKGGIVELVWALRVEPPRQNPILLLNTLNGYLSSLSFSSLIIKMRIMINNNNNNSNP